MPVELRFPHDATAEFCRAGRVLARYEARPSVPRDESPRPVLHPVSTLRGEVVTRFRPPDHPWHHGISWAFTYINGDTFWGGPTFLRASRDYGWRKNHGWQEHQCWRVCPQRAATLEQEVVWRSAGSVALLSETRRITATGCDTRSWRLDFESRFGNVAGQALTMSSPVVEGRPEGGYFGLMWRGSARWAEGTVSGDDPASPLAMGGRSAWLAYERPAADDAVATLLFLDHPDNPRFPTPWFVRRADQPLVSFAFAYHEAFVLAADASLTLRYAIVVVDGGLSRAAITAFAAEARRPAAAD